MIRIDRSADECGYGNIQIKINEYNDYCDRFDRI